VAVFHRFKFEGLPALVLALVAILLASALLHFVVEAPANQLGRSLARQ
jgi:peptidoglycan/LPS O-acetylase OafA/YrhL